MRIVTASNDKTARIWDAHTGTSSPCSPGMAMPPNLPPARPTAPVSSPARLTRPPESGMHTFRPLSQHPFCGLRRHKPRRWRVSIEPGSACGPMLAGDAGESKGRRRESLGIASRKKHTVRFEKTVSNTWCRIIDSFAPRRSRWPRRRPPSARRYTAQA
jgi:hypothetical protein